MAFVLAILRLPNQGRAARNARCGIDTFYSFLFAVLHATKCDHIHAWHAPSKPRCVEFPERPLRCMMPNSSPHPVSVAAYIRQVPPSDVSLALSVAGALDALARAAVPTISGMLKQEIGLRGPPLGDALLLLVLVAVLLLEPPSARPIGDVEKKE